MASARMQRWALILSGFNYRVEYIKGCLNEADSFSRMPQVNFISENEEISYINLIETDNSINLSFKDIARETKRDKILSKVSEAISRGNLSNVKGDDFAPYREKHAQMSVEYGCIMWGYRTVVPEKLRKTIICELHSSHLGIVKTKALARLYIWWPCLYKDIESIVRNCQQLLSSPEKSSLIPWVPSSSVWSRIHVDFAGPINNFYFFIVIDSFSKFVEVFKTKEITTTFTIGKMR